VGRRWDKKRGKHSGEDEETEAGELPAEGESDSRSRGGYALEQKREEARIPKTTRRDIGNGMKTGKKKQ